MRDVVVIGAGLAGLAAAIKAADAGLSVTLITKGVGGIQLGTGTVDILGYGPDPVEANNVLLFLVTEVTLPSAPLRSTSLLEKPEGK